ncbi:hypothetical protein V6N11_013391 [Hibiscus sabdariffa]|uniref:Uncharacterized protein n=1 Tax=Hibiscus sabdariffa TaxID=183260 RepID=A0ABR2NN68_9ROSI
MIKPSSSKLHLLKPFKLSLLDQLSPKTYSSIILFYTKPGDSHFSDQLKQSLSKALTQFYPVSGRLKNNLFITDYDDGVPQHKIIDASTIQAFIKSWTAFSRGSDGEIPNPGLLEASSRLFPPLESVPETADVKSLLLNDGRRTTTRSFVFDADAIATLLFKAESKSLEHPSRVLALSAFVWKHAILASRSVSGSIKPAFLCQPENEAPVAGLFNRESVCDGGGRI